TDISTQIAVLKAKPHEPARLEAQREVIQKLIDGLKMRKDAYDLAYEYLEKASTYMRSTISPQLTQYATEYFCEASGYDYSALGVDTNLNLTFDSDAHTRSADYLSDGTRDTAYLCLRLALIKMIYRQGKVPAVLDDAFGHLDPKRLASMLSVLGSAYEDGQVFIFTCRSDEQTLLEQIGKPPHMLSLS
ncbi:MAG TPA: hypothetical protein PLT66_08335, partial [Bacillota bacterium]|nr:hypothetical protein [Bacillota bacterium]